MKKLSIADLKAKMNKPLKSEKIFGGLMVKGNHNRW